jgi:hypothetical protein
MIHTAPELSAIAAANASSGTWPSRIQSSGHNVVLATTKPPALNRTTAAHIERGQKGCQFRGRPLISLPILPLTSFSCCLPPRCLLQKLALLRRFRGLAVAATGLAEKTWLLFWITRRPTRGAHAGGGN